MKNIKYTVSATPHVRSNDSIEKIMRDVIYALLPAVLISIYVFGIKALLIYVVTIVSCLLFEFLYQKGTKQEITINDFSAVVTGLLLAMNLPVSTSIWVPIVGSFIAIILIKQLFGGLGQNFMNPALGARAFLLAAYPTQMTNWSNPINYFSKIEEVDAISSATPLAILKSTEFIPQTSDYINALFGSVGGCLGETSAFALILGGLYLLYKKVITWRIPFVYIGTVFVLSLLLNRELGGSNALYELLVGGLMLGAFYMATDYSSSPMTPVGQIIYAFGCGLLTVLIRFYGGYPEGVSYSILIMSLTVPLLDKYTRPKVFGVSKKPKEVS